MAYEVLLMVFDDMLWTDDMVDWHTISVVALAHDVSGHAVAFFCGSHQLELFLIVD